MSPLWRRKVFTLVTSLQNINVTVLGLNNRQVLGLHDRPTPCQILKTELSKRALKYTHFELKSIVIQENNINFRGWFKICDCFILASLTILMVLRLSAAFENNWCGAHSGAALFKRIWSQMRRSFGGGAQSGAALKRVNTVYSTY